MLSALAYITVSGLLVGAPQTVSQPQTNAQTTAHKIETFLKLCETSRRGAIAQLEYTLRGLRSEQSKTRESARRIADIEEDLRVLRANKEPVVPTFFFPPDIGAIGRLPRISGHVEQILSDREMLVRCFFTVRVTSVANFERRGETIERPVVFLIRGPSTRATHEGADLELPQVFEITGRRHYRTVDGRTSEALVISEFDMKAVEPYFRREAIASKR